MAPDGIPKFFSNSQDLDVYKRQVQPDNTADTHLCRKSAEAARQTAAGTKGWDLPPAGQMCIRDSL